MVPSFHHDGPAQRFRDSGPGSKCLLAGPRVPARRDRAEPFGQPPRALSYAAVAMEPATTVVRDTAVYYSGSPHVAGLGGPGRNISVNSRPLEPHDLMAFPSIDQSFSSVIRRRPAPPAGPAPVQPMLPSRPGAPRVRRSRLRPSCPRAPGSCPPCSSRARRGHVPSPDSALASWRRFQSAAGRSPRRVSRGTD